MRLIAHRGFAATAPENTVAAIRAAGRRADRVEFDVRRCGSGELVVVHDETIDRVTDGVGPVADASLAELRTRTVLESGQPIPSLEEALAALPADVGANVELKEPGVAADALEALEAAAVSDRAVVTSFLAPELRTVRDLAPSQSTGLLTDRRHEAPVTTAVELDCDAIGASWWRCLFTPLVRRAKAVDLEVHAWSIERPLAARLLAARGVDAVSADRPLPARDGD